MSNVSYIFFVFNNYVMIRKRMHPTLIKLRCTFETRSYAAYVWDVISTIVVNDDRRKRRYYLHTGRCFSVQLAVQRLNYTLGVAFK